MKSFHSFRSSDKQAGFSLVEMAVVAAIIGFLSTVLITSFSRSRIDMEQSANLVMSVFRDAQIKAVASAVYGGYNPCGYGVHYINSTQFAVYVGPNAATVNCSTIDKNYQAGEDTLLPSQSFIENRVQFTSSFSDVYFQPPDPKTYINNNASLNQAPLSIVISPVGSTCPTNCRTIYVYPSGKIESQ